MPDKVRRAAYAAMRWREPAIPVADITFDSVMEDGGTLKPRRVRFEAPDCVVEIVVTMQSGRMAWTLVLTPAHEYDLVIRRDGGRSRRVTTDAQGHALVTRAPQGIVSVLVLRSGSDTPVARTAWVPF